MKTRRQVGKGFNAWRGKSRAKNSTKMCVKSNLNDEVIDYLSKSFSSDQASSLTKLFNNKNAEEIATQLKLLQQKVLQTRRFRSFFNKCFFEQSMNGDGAFYLDKEMVKSALNKMEQRQLKQNLAKIKVYSQYDNGTWQ